MARPRKLLSEQKGHLTVETQLQKKQEEQIAKISSRHFIDTIPRDLLITEVAENEYLRIVQLAKEIEFLCDLDLNNIVGYCNAFSLYMDATNQLKSERLTTEKYNNDGEVIGMLANPLCAIQKQYADEMRRFGSLIGTDINSRLKIATAKTKEINDNIEDTFGGI